MISATWKSHPVDNVFGNAANWIGGNVPTATATFGASSIHAIQITATASFGGWTVGKTAPNYTFSVLGNQAVHFVGAGIVTQGKAQVTVNITSGAISFATYSTAGNAHINSTGVGVLEFFDWSTAGNARINAHDVLNFFDSSSAGKSVIASSYGLSFYDNARAGSASIRLTKDITSFYNNSTAANAHINIVHGTTATTSVQFVHASTAGHATIFNGEHLVFSSTASADHAHITSVDRVTFEGHATAANAVMINNGALFFGENATGGSARLIMKSMGILDISGGNGPNGDGFIRIGSIEGGGKFELGDNTLAVGGNGRSTTVTGKIMDGGSSGGIGGSLVKVGKGTLTLAHADNSFTGGILLSKGTLVLAAKGAAGAEGVIFQDFSQTLKITNKALPAHHFAAPIVNMNIGDALDLTGLKFVKGAKATFNFFNETLKVKSGATTVTLDDFRPLAFNFKVVNDGHGGTKVLVVAAHAKSAAGSDGLAFKSEIAPAASLHSADADAYGAIQVENAGPLNDSHDMAGFPVVMPHPLVDSGASWYL